MSFRSKMLASLRSSSCRAVKGKYTHDGVSIPVQSVGALDTDAAVLDSIKRTPVIRTDKKLPDPATGAPVSGLPCSFASDTNETSTGHGAFKPASAFMSPNAVHDMLASALTEAAALENNPAPENPAPTEPRAELTAALADTGNGRKRKSAASA